MAVNDDPRSAFIEAACVPLDRGHASGSLDEAEAILAAHPEVAASDIHTAAILGDAGAVRTFLAEDRSRATATAAPRGWDALTHLCFSRYLRLDGRRSDGFVDAARALLDAGASANTGFFEPGHRPTPEWESALYGAAGVAHHAGVTRLLLEHGADPNDEEVPYHAPETHDNAALAVLVESGRLNADSLGVILLRKSDWHDNAGITWLLDRGVDPNRMTRFGTTVLHHAIRRDNELAIIEALLDHGANPELVAGGRTVIQMAARRGRGDVLRLLERRGTPIVLGGLDRLAAACAVADAGAVRDIAAAEPDVVRQAAAEGGALLTSFAAVGNDGGVRLLLDLGVDLHAGQPEADPYWGVAEGSTALHVASWRARHDTVKLLLARGAHADMPDARGRTPLALAVSACVDSFWSHRRSPESVRALLEAGANPAQIGVPTGYAEIDALLREYSSRS